MSKESAILMLRAKNMLLGFLLTFFFGSLGLFYASILGGIIMSIIEVIVIVIAVVTLGIGAILFPVTHIMCIIWALVAITRHNNRLIANA